MNYSELKTAILNICKTINLTFTKEGDGRIVSAIKEKEYLDLLEKGLLEKHSTLQIIRPKERYWYDIRIHNIPFNLKITSGGTDNAFNKTAILYTLTGKELEKKNMNYNGFLKQIKETPWKTQRDPTTEYHYLVVHKDTGKVLLKSVLDIHQYKSNPCNDLQINWNHEFNHLDYESTDSRKKSIELLETVQTSVKQAIEGMKEFAEAKWE